MLEAYEAYASQLVIVGKKYGETKVWDSFLKSGKATGKEKIFEHFEAAYFHKMDKFIA